MGTLKEIKVAVRTLDPNEDEEGEAFKAQVVMLSALEVGTGVKALAKFTGYPIALVAKFSFNLRKSGIWNGSGKARKVCANWFDEKDGGISFAADTCVALGLMERHEA